MLAIKILDIKKCMNLMLTADTFDRFLLGEANIVTKINYVIDGHFTEGYLSQEEKDALGYGQEQQIPYGQVRGLCFDMIKGKRTPQTFRFTFLLGREELEKLLLETGIAMTAEQVANLTLNIKFAKGELLATATCSLHSFTLDRSLEEAWEAWVLNFFQKAEIAVEKV